MKSSAKLITNCRSCGAQNLIDIIHLGDQYVSDFVESKALGTKAPLALIMCQDCSLVQLKNYGVDPDLLYRNYWYKSGINQTMRDALKAIVQKAEKLVPLKKGDVVLDIGANDGTTLRSYSNPTITKIGFEPARNLVNEAEVGNNVIINNYFNAEEFKKTSKKKAKIVTSIAMFYDLEDPNTFVDDITKVLDKNGLWIIQLAYEPSMLTLNAFDNICHEHIEYYSMTSLKHLLERHNLEVFDVDLNDVNGGSFRVYVKHKASSSFKSKAGKARVQRLLKDEAALEIANPETYTKFAKRVTALKNKTLKFIEKETKKGKKIFAYGASTKGNTLLQYYGLDHSKITAAAERNALKWGLKTVGTLIPIISEDEARKLKPDYLLVLPWHFRPEFIARETEYLKKGGKMIFPLPEFEVVSKD
jgi:NDP-4-keto-2,6-dideoxyhexose 3-C-methyltransferase